MLAVNAKSIRNDCDRNSHRGIRFMMRIASALSLAVLLLITGCSGSNGSGAGNEVPTSASQLAQVTVVGGVASFPGMRSQYVVTRTATGFTVTDITGTSEVVAARALQFADVRIDLTIADKAAGIAAADLKSLIELYVGYFNRLPDAEGLSYWIDQLKAGKSLDEIGKSFYAAALQYPALTGYSATMSDADFVGIIYKNVLGRSSVDAEGLAYWTNALATRTQTRASLVRTILASAHSLSGDAVYGWVASLLDNKASAANYFAVQQAITYNLASDSISNTMAIAAAVTPTDVGAATRLTDAVAGASGQSLIAGMSEAQAARLLLQAQFSASDEEIASVRAKGAAGWLDEQFSAPPGILAWDWLDSRGYNVISSDTKYYDADYVSDRMAWSQLMTAPDPVRARVALALSEMMVVSVTGVDVTWRGYAMASYWDALSSNAFGNFRRLIDDVTVNVATGRYLSSLGSRKETAAGNQPDENYAREVMQLYTIGLYQLNLDGTEQLDSNGAKIETYGASDVSNLARVFTGFIARRDTSPPTIVALDNNRSVTSTITAKPPMQVDATQHSTLAVNFLNVSIPANTDAATALRMALDGLFNHPNVGPFLAKQMIQRLVTSNPSPAYVGRVAQVFNNNGSGVRGDLRAVFRAILLDDEARNDALLTANGVGKLREPMLRLVQWGRTFADLGSRDRWKLGDQSNPATQIGQSPLRASSVFNFFRPGYVPPSTVIASSNRVAPEFQIVNESSVGGYINAMQTITRTGITSRVSDVAGLSTNQTVAADYTRELALVTNAPALVARLNLLLCAGQLTGETQTLIVQALNAIPLTATSTTSQKLDRIGNAVLMVMASPEYLLQK
jgi:uncharacterized protein (DUF1800 family)